MKQNKTPQQSNETGKKGLFGYIMLGIGISVISLFAATYWFFANVVTGVNESHQNKLIQIYTQQLQSNIDAAIAAKTKQLTSVAQRASVIRLVNDSTSDLGALSTQIKQEFSDAISVHLFRAGEAVTNDQVSPPVNFATLDLIRRVEQGQDVNMEILTQGGKYYIQVARPVRDGSIIGTLLVNLEIEFLDQALLSFDTTAGSLTLEQQFGTNPSQAIIQKGFKSENNPRLLNTANPNWQLSYQPADSVAHSIILKPEQLLIPMAIVIAIVIISLFVTGQMLQSTVKQDASNFTRYTQKLLTGQPMAVPSFKLSLFLAMAKSLARVKIKARQPMNKEVTNPFNNPVYPSVSESVTQEKGAVTPTDDILDIDMNDDDMDILGINKQAAVQVTKSSVKESIFRAYDIRGIAGQDIDRSVARQIGIAFGSEAIERKEQTILVARDGRLSSVELARGLVEGLIASGRDVVDLGEVPTPLLYFAFHELGVKSGVMVTASHQPANVNGFKLVMGGQDLSHGELKGLYHRINNENFVTGQGSYSEKALTGPYVERVFADMQLSRKLKIVIDAGNGVAGPIAKQLYSNLGCTVVPLNCDVNGQFPSHFPDPGKEENMLALVEAVKTHKAHLGIAFDGDGDRIGFVTSTGRIISPDKLLMLLSKDILSRNKGASILYDVNCSRRLQGLVVGFGGKPQLGKAGRLNLMLKMKETGALLAGNHAGSIFFKERWYGFDDGIYAGARLLELIAGQPQSSEDLFVSFPDDRNSGELHIPVDPLRKQKIIDRLSRVKSFTGGTVHTVDGLRVDFSDGWGVVRASETAARLSCRFEADTDSALMRIQESFKQELRAIDSTLDFPF